MAICRVCRFPLSLQTCARQCGFAGSAGLAPRAGGVVILTAVYQRSDLRWEPNKNRTWLGRDRRLDTTRRVDHSKPVGTLRVLREGMSKDTTSLVSERSTLCNRSR